MNTSRLVAALAVCSLLAPAPPVRADEASDPAWDAVRRLRPQTAVVITMAGGERVAGNVANVSDRSLVLRTDSREVEYPRSKIARIDRKSRPSKKKAALIGLGIGVGSYAVGHALIYSDERAPVHSADAYGFALTAGLGAGIGWLVGRDGGAEAVYVSSSN